MNRKELLAAAVEAVSRGKAYGNVERCFSDIADLWSAYLRRHVSATDVAVCMVLLKTVRYRSEPRNPDHLVDIAGYAACAAELDKPGL